MAEEAGGGRETVATGVVLSAHDGNGTNVVLSGTISHAGVPPGHEQSPGVIDVSGPMMLLTWITFGILAFLLYKIAWKPILKGLEQREAGIRKSLDDAEKARAEMTSVEARTQRMIADARAAGDEIVSAARKSATELATSMEKRAQEKTVAMTEEARREIAAATEKARMALRAESAELAIMLAGRIVGENMDSEKNRALIRKVLSGN
jgi:F-type H+-transporting ATPase subunit b